VAFFAIFGTVASIFAGVAYVSKETTILIREMRATTREDHVTPVGIRKEKGEKSRQEAKDGLK
jgi:hypothetical protein